MKTLLLIIFLTIFAVSCKTERKKIIDRYPNGKPATVIVFPDQSDTTRCNILGYHDNGNIAVKVSIEKGQYVGQKLIYYYSGKIKQIDSLSKPCDSTQDECDGSLIRYYENGNISQHYTVKNNIFNGISQHFSSKGILVKEYELKNGMTKNGIYKEFYDNGKVAFKCQYQNDTIIGFAYYFNEKEDTTKYYNHYNGIIYFPYKKWLDNGLILFGDFTDKSEKSAIWNWYDKNGKKVKSKFAYVNDEGFVAPE